MTASWKAAALGAAMMTCALPAQALTLTHAWELNGSAADSQGGPALNLLDPTGLESTGYRFSAGMGASVANAIGAETWSIEMLLTLDDVEDYNKVLDFAGRSSDNGLYIREGSPYFFGPNNTLGGAFTADEAHHLVMTRDGAAGVYSVYLDGALLGSHADGGRGVFSTPDRTVWLLKDDGAVTGEESGGFLDYVRFYSDVLTPAEVLALSTADPAPSQVPLPAALPLLGLGAAALALLRGRKAA